MCSSSASRVTPPLVTTRKSSASSTGLDHHPDRGPVAATLGTTQSTVDYLFVVFECTRCATLTHKHACIAAEHTASLDHCSRQVQPAGSICLSNAQACRGPAQTAAACRLCRYIARAGRKCGKGRHCAGAACADSSTAQPVTGLAKALLKHCLCQ
jgi:hypothetical protein